MGKVYLLGAGPGDPELLTLKAFRILREAEVILYDRLVSAEILALANPAAILIHTGKRHGEQEEIQNEINNLMLDHWRAGRTVVRLKGGDPMVFGRGAEEWALLVAHGAEVELVPGVSSAIAVPALAGIPVTFRGVASSFAVITGHNRKSEMPDWSKFRGVDTLVILMGVENRAQTAAELIRLGRPASEPVGFVERGSTDRERVVTATLGEVAAGLVEVCSPAVCIVGEVVRLRTKLTVVGQALSPANVGLEAVHAR